MIKGLRGCDGERIIPVVTRTPLHRPAPTLAAMLPAAARRVEAARFRGQPRVETARRSRAVLRRCCTACRRECSCLFIDSLFVYLLFIQF